MNDDIKDAGEWIVMCQVSGGVTGTRCAPLKANGIVQFFQTEAEAQAAADRLTNNRSPYSTASFHYWPEPRWK